MKAKPCPICGGDPIYVEYAIPKDKEPDLWEETDEGLEPIALLKQIECMGCGARGWLVSISCIDVIKSWNDENIMQLICREPAPKEET